MNRMVSLLLPAVFLAVASTSAAKADMPSPFGHRPRPLPHRVEPAPIERPAQLVIRRDNQATLTRLKIPCKLVSPDKGRWGAALLPLPTPIIGLSLSLALAFGGVWLARSRWLLPRSGVAVGLFAIALAGLAASTLWADVAPPWMKPFQPRRPVETPCKPLAELVASGNLSIEIVPTGENVELILGKDMAEQLAKRLVPQKTHPVAPQEGAAPRQ